MKAILCVATFAIMLSQSCFGVTGKEQEEFERNENDGIVELPLENAHGLDDYKLYELSEGKTRLRILNNLPFYSDKLYFKFGEDIEGTIEYLKQFYENPDFEKRVRGSFYQELFTSLGKKEFRTKIIENLLAVRREKIKKLAKASIDDDFWYRNTLLSLFISYKKIAHSDAHYYARNTSCKATSSKAWNYAHASNWHVASNTCSTWDISWYISYAASNCCSYSKKSAYSDAVTIALDTVFLNGFNIKKNTNQVPLVYNIAEVMALLIDIEVDFLKAFQAAQLVEKKEKLLSLKEAYQLINIMIRKNETEELKANPFWEDIKKTAKAFYEIVHELDY